MPPKKKSEVEKMLSLQPVDENVVIPKKSAKDIMAALNRGGKLTGYNKIQTARNFASPSVIPSGILELDYKLKVGGFPRGKVVQLYGAEASYKSTVCLKTVAEAQKISPDCVCLWVDAEHAFDGVWAEAHGVDLDRLLVYPPDTQEDALNAMENASKQGVDVIVLDSLIALAPMKELYTDNTKKTIENLDKEQMGIFARNMSKWFRRVMKVFAENKTLVMIINQIRSSLSPYGPPTSVPGGKAVKYYNTISINFKRLTSAADQILDSNKNPIGAKYQFTIDKTRYDAIGKTGVIVTVGPTVDNYTTLRDVGIDQGLIKKLSTVSYDVDGLIVKGKDNINIELLKNKELTENLMKQCRAKMGFNITLKHEVESDGLDITEEEMNAAEEDIEVDEVTAEENE